MRKLFIFQIFILLVCSLNSRATEVGLESLKAAFIYKFTNYIEWPKEEAQSFNIGILNNEELFFEMKTMLEGKFVNNLPVNVKYFSKLEKNFKYHILHVQHMSPQLAQEIKQHKSLGLLIISQSDDEMHEEAIVNFYVDQEKKLRFEINNEKAVENGLKINSRLLNLSRNKK